MQVLRHPPSGWPCLVLNADFRPLSYYPLSLWPWQEVIKAVFLDRVDVVSTYEQEVHSPSFAMKLPSVVALKSYVAQDRPPAFTRNAAGARHINIAHGLYPRTELPEPVLARLVEGLRRTVSIQDGRTYAGGLTKFEPREMERLAVPDPFVVTG